MAREDVEDLLPDISIRTDVSPTAFLSRIRRAVADIPGYRHRHDLGPKAEPPVVYVEACLRSVPGVRKAGTSLFPHFENRDRVSVELYSEAWRGKSPSYREFAAVAHELLTPVLSAYNKRFKSRRRLHVPSQNALEPRLSPVVRRVFDQFIALANRAQLHPRDWDRFYSLIRAAHVLHTQTRGEEIARLLLREGFDHELAQQLGNIYEHGRGLLKAKRSWARRPLRT